MNELHIHHAKSLINLMTIHRQQAYIFIWKFYKEFIHQKHKTHILEHAESNLGLVGYFQDPHEV